MAYLTFILPPIIIITSLALIIFIVSKKTLEVEKRIEKGEKLEENNNKIVNKVKSDGLSFLEKLARLFKILLLKWHNWIESKLTFIKKKKIEIKKAEIEAEINNGSEIKDDKNINNKNVEKKKLVIFKTQINKRIVKKIEQRKENRDNNVNLKQKNAIDKKKEELNRKNNEKQRVMISDKVVYPERKNELEKILIERIAFDPRDISAYEKLGDYYAEQKSDKNAIECYDQVLRLNPHNLNVREKLGRIK